MLSGFALGVMSVLALVVWRDYGKLTVAKTFVFILIAGACFLVEPQLSGIWALLAADLYTMVPALFWVLCQLAFSRRPKVFSLTGFIALYTILAPMFARHFVESHNESLMVFLWTWPSYCEYLMIALGLWTVVASWSDDLVESRRQLRGAVLIAVGISVLLVVIPANTHIVGRWLPYLSINIITLTCAYFLLHTHQGVLFGVVNPVSTTDVMNVPTNEDANTNVPELNLDAQKLNNLMAQGFYRTEHLTLKDLASELALPEYKTRNLINQTLGYRNFNDYINQLRIHEAAERLKREPDSPILNISLDVGYRTLSSFNRAFKDIMSMSPSEYRAKQ
ncbi:helix-turn-helix domain-containing protein [Bermanella sp. WJH001]|uniref:helix-turn-helix domain-containing protein n=1 Tax=Bermanella sp. WJH001 TaxID=3048005 RepID=UPI0024BE0234|nr:helix-turn-helix domain-containing protein [Bermanella sp. WJH001]MDJ1537569.1 helix-turn-helix domain-containing protein [Bermanella sp. WJH001]